MSKLLVFDLETTIGTTSHSGSFRDPANDFVTLIYGDNPNNIHVEYNENGFNRQISKRCESMLENSDYIVGHNLPFDLGYIYNTEAFQRFIKKGGRVFDTQLAEYLLSGQRHQYASLGELQLLYLDEKVKADRISKLFSKKHGADEFLKNKERCPRLYNLFDKYCYDDGQSTFRVAIKQIERIKKEGMMPIVKIYNEYMLGLVSTMASGIHVDKIKCEKTLRAFKVRSIQYLKESEEIVSKYWDDEKLPKFNVQSPTHKSALLFGGAIKCKVKEDAGFYKNGNPKTKIMEYKVQVDGFRLPTHLTAPSEVKGRYKTGADIIHKIYNYTDNKLIKKYCKLQKAAMNLEKMCSTYLEPFLNLSIDGIIYPYYNNTATWTGRLSSKLPNLQNIPSKGGIEKYIKNQLVAPEGYICCSIDFSQLEIFVQALVTKDPTLTRDLLDGVDFHILRLSYAEDMPYDEVYKLCKVDKLPEWELKRSKAKTISYQKAYGASPRKLAESTGLSEEVIKKIFVKEDIEYPNVKLFNDHVTQEVNNSQTLSLSKNIPKFRKGFTKYSKRFVGGIELLPIMKDTLDADYFKDELRNVGYHKSITGKKYAFEEFANYDRFGRIRRGYKPTQIKNYPQQGGAADIVAMATAELFRYILTLKDKEVIMVNQIHDSIEFYVKEDVLDLTIPKLASIMEGTKKLFKKYLDKDIPFDFRVDVKIGPNFYDMEEYK